ncbi:MAG: DNA-directed RNA polymerase sigma-70 factor [Cyclobacteriaceae bacterium]|nr:MAG: DNA-directed RNA polymerase sigma-70 factor [Cyclobacteriaceae bacterium]
MPQDFTTESGFKDLYEQYYTDLHRTAYRIVGNAEAAEDIVHEIFLKIWEKRNDLKISVDLSFYLKRSAINGALNYLKKNPVIGALEQIEEIPADSFINYAEDDMRQKVTAKLNKAIDTLPPKCRLIFSLSRFEGMSNQEIANYTGVTKKTVENQLNKAFYRLRKDLKPYFRYLTNASILLASIIFLENLWV